MYKHQNRRSKICEHRVNNHSSGIVSVCGNIPFSCGCLNYREAEVTGKNLIAQLVSRPSLIS